jgi:colicin import membrane protein
METSGDKARAFLYALLMHVLCIGSLFLGLMFAQSPTQQVVLAGSVIDVDLVGITKAPAPTSKPVRQAQKPAPPKPQEAVKPPEPQPQSPTQVEQQDKVNREKIAEIAQEKADAERAQDEKRRQEQVQLEKDMKQERDRQRQLDQIKKQREAAQKQLALEKQRLEQMQDVQNQKPVKKVTQAVPPGDTAVSGAEGKDDSLQAQYFAAIQNAITNNWLRDDSVKPGLHCVIHIVQIPGGDVIGVQISNPCNADQQTRTSIEQAVRRASPLPAKGFESVFQRDFNLNFTYDG